MLKVFIEDFIEVINLLMGIVFVLVVRLLVLCDLFFVLEFSVENFGGKLVNGVLVIEEEFVVVWFGDIVVLVGCG